MITDRSSGGQVAESGSRERALNAAIALASKKGLSALTIGMLAKAVGMSKSGLFGLFRSKDALLQEVVLEVDARFFKAVVEPTRAFPVGIARLARLMEAVAANAAGRGSTDRCFLFGAVAELEANVDPVKEALRRFVGRFRAAIVDALEEAVQAGHIVPGISPHNFFRTVVGATLTTTWFAHLDGDEDTARAEGVAQMRATVAYIATPAGTAILAEHPIS